MALTGRKLCKLDAICAKLKQINQEPAHNKDNDRCVPMTLADDNGGHFETQDEPADLSMKPKKCLNNNIIEDFSIHRGTKETDDAQDLTVLKPKAKENETVGTPDFKNQSFKNHETQENSAKTVGSNSKGESFSGSSIKDSPKLTPVGSSRRKSRKASTPRNIVQIQKTYNNIEQVDEKDELAEYEINNQNTNFPPEEGEEDIEKNSYNSSHNSSRSNESVLDSSQSFKELDKSGEHSKQTEEHSKRTVDSGSNIGAPLDLSVSKTDEPSTANGYLSSDEDEMDHNLVIDETDYEKTASVQNDSSHMPSGESRRESGERKAHAAHLKDYAESTMNELISMYGYSGPGLLSDSSRTVPGSNYENLLQQVNGLIHMKKEPVDPEKQPMVNGDDRSHDRSQPIPGLFTNTSSHSTPSALVKVEGKEFRVCSMPRLTAEAVPHRSDLNKVCVVVYIHVYVYIQTNQTSDTAKHHSIKYFLEPIFPLLRAGLF